MSKTKACLGGCAEMPNLDGCPSQCPNMTTMGSDYSLAGYLVTCEDGTQSDFYRNKRVAESGKEIQEICGSKDVKLETLYRKI